MAGATLNWEEELQSWLKPFLEYLGHKARRRMCPLYVAGLIGPGDRKSVPPLGKALRDCAAGAIRVKLLRRSLPSS
jgi:hypothetical protein